MRNTRPKTYTHAYTTTRPHLVGVRRATLGPERLPGDLEVRDAAAGGREQHHAAVGAEAGGDEGVAVVQLDGENTAAGFFWVGGRGGRGWMIGQV